MPRCVCCSGWERTRLSADLLLLKETEVAPKMECEGSRADPSGCASPRCISKRPGHPRARPPWSRFVTGCRRSNGAAEGCLRKPQAFDAATSISGNVQRTPVWHGYVLCAHLGGPRDDSFILETRPSASERPPPVGHRAPSLLSSVGRAPAARSPAGRRSSLLSALRGADRAGGGGELWRQRPEAASPPGPAQGAEWTGLPPPPPTADCPGRFLTCGNL